MKEYNDANKREGEPDMPDELLTIEQVAAELQLHPDTVRRYIRERKLTGVRISSTVVRVRRSELDKFLRERSTDDEES
jgi:excisionase family DNA binding protein